MQSANMALVTTSDGGFLMKKIFAFAIVALTAITMVFAGGASEDDGVYTFATDATWHRPATS